MKAGAQDKLVASAAQPLTAARAALALNTVAAVSPPAAAAWLEQLDAGLAMGVRGAGPASPSQPSTAGGSGPELASKPPTAVGSGPELASKPSTVVGAVPEHASKPSTAVGSGLQTMGRPSPAAGAGRQTPTEHARAGGSPDAQLLAAAHAVASYWLSAQAAGRQSLANQAAPAETAAAASGGGQPPTIRIDQLTPDGGLAAVQLVHPDLGALALEVSLSGRTLSVLATTGSEHAAAAIRAGQAALSEQLAAQNITLHALEVVVVRRRAPAQSQKSKRQES